MVDANATMIPVANTLLSFSTQLFATLIGAFVGFGLVIFWDRRKKKQEIKNTKNSMINSITQELKENQNGLKIFKMPSWDINEGRFQGNFGLASIPAFQSAVSGGDFLLMPTEIQKPVREIYHNFELYNEFMKDIIRFSSFNYGREQASKEAYNLTGRLQERINELGPALSDVMPKLESAIEII